MSDSKGRKEIKSPARTNKNASATSHTSTRITIEQKVSNAKRGPHNIKRSLDPNDVVIQRRFGEGSKPLFSRDDIRVNRGNTESPKRRPQREKSSSSSSSGGRTQRTSNNPRRERSHSPKRKTPEKIPYFIDARREEDRLRAKNERARHLRRTRSRSRPKYRSSSRDRRRQSSRNRTRRSPSWSRRERRSRSRSRSYSRRRYRSRSRRRSASYNRYRDRSRSRDRLSGRTPYQEPCYIPVPIPVEHPCAASWIPPAPIPPYPRNPYMLRPPFPPAIPYYPYRPPALAPIDFARFPLKPPIRNNRPFRPRQPK